VPWQLLVPGAHQWCRVAPFVVEGAPTAAGSLIGEVTPLAGKLWWSGLLSASSGPTGDLASTSLASLRCQ
jgi:hypothetical protein